jgi:predicted  nucleic acid-binding Zn-ribbon protein
MRRNKKNASDRRPPTDRQVAFVEFKSTPEAQQIEQDIVECRHALKDKRNELRSKTEEVNMIKNEIDNIKAFLDDKTEKKKQNAITQAMAPGFSSHTDGFDMDDNEYNDVIDEEELVKLKEIKELKKQYRTAYKELKDLRAETKYTQTGIDNNKEQLIKIFEEWYDDNFESEFEYKKRQAETKLNTQGSRRTTPGQGVRLDSEANDDEGQDEAEREGIDVDPSALAYIRSRKSVHKLNNARKDMLKV